MTQAGEGCDPHHRQNLKAGPLGPAFPFPSLLLERGRKPAPLHGQTSDLVAEVVFDSGRDAVGDLAAPGIRLE